jgi:hypothetical protein
MATQLKAIEKGKYKRWMMEEKKLIERQERTLQEKHELEARIIECLRALENAQESSFPVPQWLSETLKQGILQSYTQAKEMLVAGIEDSLVLLRDQHTDCLQRLGDRGKIIEMVQRYQRGLVVSLKVWVETFQTAIRVIESPTEEHSFLGPHQGILVDPQQTELCTSPRRLPRSFPIIMPLHPTRNGR